MKQNNKISDLIVEGISIETLRRLTPKQIDLLHSRIVKEQSTGSVTKKQTTATTYKIPSGTARTSGAEVDGMAIRTDSAGNIELTKTQATESDGKKTKKNPWAICTASLSDEFGTSERSDWTKPQMKKYERCVLGVKKSLKENRNPYEFLIESKIVDIVKKHIEPRMTKKDLINTLIERSTKEKEITKTPEKEKGSPTKTPSRVNPFRDPSPGTKEKPRGKSEKIKSDFINLIKNLVG